MPNKKGKACGARKWQIILIYSTNLLSDMLRILNTLRQTTIEIQNFQKRNILLIN